MIAERQMKDSGIDWIGDIPEAWRCLRNKYFTSPIKSPSEDGTEALLSVTENHGVVPRENVKNFSGNLSRSESLVGYLQVEPNFLVSNIMLMWKRGLGVSRYKGIVSPAYSVFEFNDKAAPRYFDYLFRSDMYISEFRRNSTGIIMSRLRLYDDSFGAIFSHFPPLEEQKRIADYLDVKTQQIDELIEKTEKKIELLKEQRIALINHCVTKGLNPDAEMKDSGIEWIGEIPESWEIKKFKHFFAFGMGETILKEEILHEGIPILSATEGYDIFGYLRSPRLLLNKGDIVIPARGNSIGFIKLVKEVSTSTQTTIYGKCFNQKIDTNYFTYFCIGNKNELFQFDRTAIPQITVSNVENKVITLPGKEEQKQIANYLDQKTQQIDTVVEKEEKRISLLKEYRQSLISSAVTGKINITEAMV